MSDSTAATFTAGGTVLFDAAIGWAVGATGPTASTMTLAGPVQSAGGDDGAFPPPRSGHQGARLT